MSTPPRSPARVSRSLSSREPAQLADVLERVLDKGIVIVGDIRINLLDIELLTVKLRLLVASADKAREMGIDWWEGDPFLTRGSDQELIDRVKRLERAAGLEDGNARAHGGEDAQSR
jgi:Gas vesicle protein